MAMPSPRQSPHHGRVLRKLRRACYNKHDTRVLFDHQQAEAQVGASIFWLCPSVLLRGSLADFILGWWTKRDLTQRGIVEVVS